MMHRIVLRPTALLETLTAGPSHIVTEDVIFLKDFVGRSPDMIITIDGPAGAGKSTVARALARRLGFRFLDTGAMYRAVAFGGLCGAVWIGTCRTTLARLARELDIQTAGERILLDGHDVTDAVRTSEVDPR